MTYNLSIKKNAGGDWIVEPNGGPSVVSPGDKVKWQISPGANVTAHIQFLDDIFEASSSVDEHLVSVLQQGNSLELTVAGKALPDPRVRQRTYGYAVAVHDASSVAFAIGSNPPPDLVVGD